MEEVFSKVVAIIIGCIALFIVPLKILSVRQENMHQTYILTETICFVDSVCNKGILYSDLYTEYLKKISSYNKIYKVKLEHIKNDNNNDYTEQILNELEKEGSHKFIENDIFRVEIIDSSGNPVIFYGGCIKDEDY